MNLILPMVDGKGRIVIPSAIRKELKLGHGSLVHVQVDSGMVRLCRVELDEGLQWKL